MKAKHRPRFDTEALRDMVGAKVFARGAAYCQDGHVRILTMDPQRVLARVTGTEDYRTEVTGRDTQIGGECSCRAFEDHGFCKHMVAVALAANGVGDDAQAGAGALGRVRDYLKQKSVDSLVGMIVDIAERDPALFRKLDMAAATLGADDKTLEAQLRKAIDRATRTAGYIDYNEVRGWAAEVDAVLDTVAGLAADGRSDLAFKLVERAIDRIERATGSIDDSDGHCGGLLHRAGEIHLAAARMVRPEPVQFARDLFARELESDFDTFDGAAGLYADVLGEQGLAEYRRLAVKAWEKIPQRSGGAGDDHEFSSGDYRLKNVLDVFAERDGDVDARIALRARDLSSPWRYLELAEFCLAQGRADEALRRAEEGMWIFEDKPDERLVLFAAKLLSKVGRKTDAEAHLWRFFEKRPSEELYVRLRKLGGDTARERAVKFLETRLATTQPARQDGTAELLVRILISEKNLAAAWMAAHTYKVGLQVKEDLARASEAAHPREALEVYAERVEQFVRNSGYAEAVKLIARMARLRNAAEQSAYVAELKARFVRKRNFMKLLR
jgi:tetratricopeptide (TPR) repeat protein